MSLFKSTRYNKAPTVKVPSAFAEDALKRKHGDDLYVWWSMVFNKWPSVVDHPERLDDLCARNDTILWSDAPVVLVRSGGMSNADMVIPPNARDLLERIYRAVQGENYVLRADNVTNAITLLNVIEGFEGDWDVSADLPVELIDVVKTWNKASDYDRLRVCVHMDSTLTKRITDSVGVDPSLGKLLSNSQGASEDESSTPSSTPSRPAKPTIAPRAPTAERSTASA